MVNGSPIPSKRLRPVGDARSVGSCRHQNPAGTELEARSLHQPVTAVGAKVLDSPWDHGVVQAVLSDDVPRVSDKRGVTWSQKRSRQCGDIGVLGAMQEMVEVGGAPTEVMANRGAHPGHRNRLRPMRPSVKELAAGLDDLQLGSCGPQGPRGADPVRPSANNHPVENCHRWELTQC